MAYYPTNGGTSCIPDCLFRLFSFCRRLCTQILLRPLEEKQYIPESLNWQETALQVFVWSAVSLFIMMKFIVIFSCFALKSVVYWKKYASYPKKQSPKQKVYGPLLWGLFCPPAYAGIICRFSNLSAYIKLGWPPQMRGRIVRHFACLPFLFRELLIF